MVAKWEITVPRSKCRVEIKLKMACHEVQVSLSSSETRILQVFLIQF